MTYFFFVFLLVFILDITSDELLTNCRGTGDSAQK